MVKAGHLKRKMVKSRRCLHRKDCRVLKRARERKRLNREVFKAAWRLNRNMFETESFPKVETSRARELKWQ